MYNCYNCECELEEGEGITSDITGEIYCECCYNELFEHCEECGSEFHREELCYYENGDLYLCPSCYETLVENDDDDDIICSYHIRDIAINFKYLESELVNGKTKDDLLYFGTEQECYNNQHKISNAKMAKMIRNKYPHLEFVFEKDSTIGGNGDGFELISQPMTMQFIKAHKEELKDINQMLIDNGFTSYNARSCGLHIHFSRNYFSDNEDKYIQKLTLFFEQYKDELIAFSRRKDFKWCAWISDRCNYDKRFLKSSLILKDYAKNNPSHQIAINLGNTSTIEIRIFRGTLKFETYMASLELVNSLVTAIKTKETRKISFDNVVNMSGNEYVQAYCEEKNIYNSQYLNDETKNVLKELEMRKQKIETIKTECKKDMTETLKDISKLSIETNSKINIDFNDDDLRITFNILSQINSVISNRMNDLNSIIFEKDDETIEKSYYKYMTNRIASPIDYYNGLISDIGYIIRGREDSELMNKLKDLYNTAKENVKKLNEMIVNQNNLEGEE